MDKVKIDTKETYTWIQNWIKWVLDSRKTATLFGLCIGLVLGLLLALPLILSGKVLYGFVIIGPETLIVSILFYIVGKENEESY